MQGKYMKNKELQTFRKSHNASTGSQFGREPNTSAQFNQSYKTSNTRLANFQTMNSQQQ